MARCTTLSGRSLKAQQCARPEPSRAAVPHPSRGGTRRTGERPDRVASDRDPGATRPVSGPGSWRPSDEGRGGAP